MAINSLCTPVTAANNRFYNNEVLLYVNFNTEHIYQDVISKLAPSCVAINTYCIPDFNLPPVLRPQEVLSALYVDFLV